MLCEHYKEALIEAASSGVAPPGDLRAHLDGCAACRAAFEQEQALFASIDGGLRVTANADVPASLLPRIRARLDAEPASWLLAQKWAYSGAILAGVLSVAAVLVLRSHQNVSSPQLTNSQPPSVVLAGIPAPPAIPATSHRAPPRASAVSKEIDATSPRALLGAEILVPEEERMAFAQFLAHASLAPVSISVGAVLAPKAPQEFVQISPMEIASLKLDPIKKEDSQKTDF